MLISHLTNFTLIPWFWIPRSFWYLILDDQCFLRDVYLQVGVVAMRPCRPGASGGPERWRGRGLTRVPRRLAAVHSPVHDRRVSTRAGACRPSLCSRAPVAQVAPSNTVHLDRAPRMRKCLCLLTQKNLKLGVLLSLIFSDHVPISWVLKIPTNSPVEFWVSYRYQFMGSFH